MQIIWILHYSSKGNIFIANWVLKRTITFAWHKMREKYFSDGNPNWCHSIEFWLRNFNSNAPLNKINSTLFWFDPRLDMTPREMCLVFNRFQPNARYDELNFCLKPAAETVVVWSIVSHEVVHIHYSISVNSMSLRFYVIFIVSTKKYLSFNDCTQLQNDKWNEILLKFNDGVQSMPGKIHSQRNI